MRRCAGRWKYQRADITDLRQDLKVVRLRRTLASQNRIDNEKLLIEIRRVFWDNNRNYGSPRVYETLRKENIGCSLNRVARLMREDNLIAIHKRKFRATTNSKHNYSVWPNVLNRDFSAEKPNVVWVSDITYVWTSEGWLYLAAILDLFSRSIVGLAMDKTLAETLTLQALRQAIGRTVSAQRINLSFRQRQPVCRQ